MKKYSLLIFLTFLSMECFTPVKDTFNQIQTFGDTTKNTKISDEKIDGSPTYEVSFTLEKPADCMTIEIDSAYLQKTFPVQKIPKNTFFIIEKKLKLANYKLKSDNTFTPIGRNFNNDWELYSPVKICSNVNDPLSTINVSDYRIRFSAFEQAELYYIITITCESKVIFFENRPAGKK